MIIIKNIIIINIYLIIFELNKKNFLDFLIK